MGEVLRRGFREIGADRSQGKRRMLLDSDETSLE